MKSILILLLALPCALASAQTGFENGQWLDLTHPFNEHSIYWPTATPFEMTTVFEGQTEGSWYYTAYEFHAAEHGGTHLDAPIHFAHGAHTNDQIPLQQLTGPGAVIHLADKIGDDRNYLVSAQDITDWEQQHGKLAPGAIVLLDTG